MKKHSFSPFPILVTERLLLRQLRDEDTAFIYKLRTASQNNTFLDRIRPKDHSATLQYIYKTNKGISDDKFLYWLICTRGEDEPVGTICLWNFDVAESCAELGYELHYPFRGQGYMREAMGSVIGYAHEELELGNLVAYTQEKNLPSARLLEYYSFQIVDTVIEKHSVTGKEIVQSVYRKEMEIKS